MGKKAECQNCGELYNYRRKQLGYKTCLNCGNMDAMREILRKASCVAPAFNKGGYMYIHSAQDAKDAGK
jgi:predicted  nucleic acid-binding Zn-ribbon protein